MVGVRTYTAVEKGSDEGLGSLSDDVVVEILQEDKWVNICRIRCDYKNLPPIEIGPLRHPSSMPIPKQSASILQYHTKKNSPDKWHQLFLSYPMD